MTGLVKQKEYDWKDSNLALFGSDTDKQVKKDSAKTEPAWTSAGEAVGIRIWRINKFKVEEWPKQDYGKFFSGDSYIILNTYNEDGSDELLYDVHFWIGKYSTQDEYGTAAYKTVELDTFLDDKPVQHREVQSHESSLFRSYFKSITLMQGGADTGFRHVKPEEYVPRLFHVKSVKSSVTVTELSSRSRDCLTSDDVFILDCGSTIYQWNGSKCNMKEKTKACQYICEMKMERSGKSVHSETLDEDEMQDEEEHEFWTYLNGESTEETRNGVDQEQQQNGNPSTEKKLFRLSDNSGEFIFNMEKEGRINRSDFDTKDVFILDTSNELIVWVGKRASKAESKNAMCYAHHYLKKSDNPLMPVSCVKEGSKSRQFELAVTA